MNIKSLSAHELLAQTKILVADERRITLRLIESLREIEARLLFADMGYGSLFEFCTKELGLSEGSAQRRIQAMRLVRDVPEAKLAIEDGSLSLSNAAKVQGFFQNEKKLGKRRDQTAKREVLSKIKNHSQRECEQVLFEIEPIALSKEKERTVSPTERELKFVVSEDVMKKIERLKSLLSHSHPETSYAALMEYLVDGALDKLEKRRGLIQKKSDQFVSIHTAAAVKVLARDQSIPFKKRIHFPITWKRELWRRSEARCEFKSDTGNRCESAYRLEIDHIQPLVLKGSNDFSNLRILCRIHNQQQAKTRNLDLRPTRERRYLRRHSPCGGKADLQNHSSES